MRPLEPRDVLTLALLGLVIGCDANPNGPGVAPATPTEQIAEAKKEKTGKKATAKSSQPISLKQAD